jgi:hypothetical protein
MDTYSERQLTPETNSREVIAWQLASGFSGTFANALENIRRPIQTSEKNRAQFPIGPLSQYKKIGSPARRAANEHTANGRHSGKIFPGEIFVAPNAVQIVKTVPERRLRPCMAEKWMRRSVLKTDSN